MNLRRLPWSWIFVGGFVATVYVTGLLGFHRYYTVFHPDSTVSWLDKAYFTGQLFTIESGSVKGPLPWSLEIARFLAPVAAAFALLNAILTSFSFQISRLWLRVVGRHIIVGGLGEKGSLLVKELLQKHRHVVVIEPDMGNPDLGECRRLGALIITARSDDKNQLRRACVRSAAELIATSGNDSANLETASIAKELCASRGDRFKKLRCIVHVSDPALQQALKQRDPFAGQTKISLEVVNILQTGARVMLDRSGVFENLPGPGETRKLLLLGIGKFGMALLNRILREWAILRAERAETSPVGDLLITLAEMRACGKEAAIRSKMEPLLEGVSLRFIDADVRVAKEVPTDGLDAAFVCFNDDELATLAALRLEESGANVPVFIRMAESAGFSSLFRDNSFQEEGESRTSRHCTCCAVGLGDVTGMLELFLNGDEEVLARAFHAAYLAERREKIEALAEDSALVRWERLNESNRVSNRTAAKGLPERLRAAGLSMIPSSDKPVTLIDLTEEEVSRLAEHEHQRWCLDRKAQGFRYGPKKDPIAKIHPLLRPWDELSPEDQASNLADSRRLPFVVARADFELVRK